MAKQQSHILVVDDDRRLRDLLKRFLTENGFRVTTAANAQEARDRMRSLSFDLLVLDLMMPGESGLELASALREESSVPILMLTAMGETEDKIAGLEAGADDYLSKPFEPRELVARIRSVLRRLLDGTSGGEINLGACRFVPERSELLRDGLPVRLTESEARLLNALARAPGAVISRDELGEGDAGGRSVDIQVTRLRRKIEDDPRAPRYLQTVRGKGYTLIPD